MSSKDDDKPGFFKRLFGGSSKKSGDRSSSKRSDGPDSPTSTSPTKPKPSHSPLVVPPVKTRTPSSGSSSGGKSPTTLTGDAAAQPARKPRRAKGAKSQKHRKRSKAMVDPGAIKVCFNTPNLYLSSVTSIVKGNVVTVRAIVVPHMRNALYFRGKVRAL